MVRRPWLSLLLWGSFAAGVVAIGAMLLHACGVGPLLPAYVNFCPLSSRASAAEAERYLVLSNQAATLARALAQKRLACVGNTEAPPPLDLPRQSGSPLPQQTASRKPVDLPADRWAQKDLSLLKGCWILGHPVPVVLRWTSGSNENCTQSAGILCFDEHGHGQNKMSINSCPTAPPYQCTAQVTVSFTGEGALAGRQALGHCSANAINTTERTLSCRRIDDTQAMCHVVEIGGARVQEQLFRRAP